MNGNPLSYSVTSHFLTHMNRQKNIIHPMYILQKKRLRQFLCSLLGIRTTTVVDNANMFTV